MSKIFKIIVNVILALTIVVLVAYFTLRATDKIRIYNVETGSMEDKIHVGDYILLVRIDNYYVGDVVTFSVDDYFITHRIISIENDKIITKGDANNLEDSEINKDQIIGKAIYWGGILNYVINYKYVIAAVLIGLYLLSCFLGEDKEFEDNEEKLEEMEAKGVGEIHNEPKAEGLEIKIIKEEKEELPNKEEKKDEETQEIKTEKIKKEVKTPKKGTNKNKKTQPKDEKGKPKTVKNETNKTKSKKQANSNKTKKTTQKKKK